MQTYAAGLQNYSYKSESSFFVVVLLGNYAKHWLCCKQEIYYLELDVGISGPYTRLISKQWQSSLHAGL